MTLERATEDGTRAPPSPRSSRRHAAEGDRHGKHKHKKHRHERRSRSRSRSRSRRGERARGATPPGAAAGGAPLPPLLPPPPPAARGDFHKEDGEAASEEEGELPVPPAPAGGGGDGDGGGAAPRVRSASPARHGSGGAGAERAGATRSRGGSEAPPRPPSRARSREHERRPHEHSRERERSRERGRHGAPRLGGGGGGAPEDVRRRDGRDRRRSRSKSRSRDRGSKRARAGDGRGPSDDRTLGRRHSRERRRSRSRSRERRRSRSRERRRSRSRSRERRRDGGGGRHGHHRGSGSESPPVIEDIAVLDEEEEERRRLEESRRRRAEILAKHKQAAAVAAPTSTEVAAAAQPQQQQEPQEQQQLEQHEQDEQQQHARPPEAAGDETPDGARSSSSDSENAPGSPVMDVFNSGTGGGDRSGDVSGDADGRPPPPLPGTEPNLQSERLRGQHIDAPPAVAKGAAAAGANKADEPDMFADDWDAAAATVADDGGGGAGGVAGAGKGLHDAYDDAEGYYNFQVGEVMDGRYELFACKGKGVFSTVLRARDMLRADPNNPGAKAEVAIKMIRSNETMARAAQLEMRILKVLSDADPEGRKHCVRLLRSFEYRSHVCLVFEPMDMNLRELTNKYGRNVGLNITAVAVYAAQLLVALRHLKRCRVLHADVKPDNILVNARRSKVKICDFGSAMFAGENERTPYLVSRFYRAPEVVLGLAYDYPMDMWSIGCVLYELFTGRILFPGRTNNDMLRVIMEVKGPFPRRMLKKGIFVDKHFEDDANMSFALVEEDPVTKMPVRRLIPNPGVKNSFAQLLARAEGDKARVAALGDLLERMMALDPEKRIDPDGALRHPFVKDYVPKKKAAPGGGGGG